MRERESFIEEGKFAYTHTLINILYVTAVLRCCGTTVVKRKKDRFVYFSKKKKPISDKYFLYFTISGRGRIFYQPIVRALKLKIHFINAPFKDVFVSPTRWALELEAYFEYRHVSHRG